MISIIVPVHNSEKYLKECLDSVISQTYQSLEIIAIDNGSSDNSLKILHEYCNKDPRIKIVIQENRGPGMSRNQGLKEAKGEYIFFIDSDDKIEKNFLQETLRFLITNKCDVVQGGICYLYEQYGLIPKLSKKKGDTELLPRIDAMSELINDRLIKNFAWGKLYRKNLLGNLKFPDKYYFEDFEWSQNVIDKCNKYGIIHRPLYFYRQHSESLTGGKVELRDKFMDVLKERLDFISERYPFLKANMEKIYSHYTTSSTNRKSFKGNLKFFIKKLKERIFYPYERIEIID